MTLLRVRDDERSPRERWFVDELHLSLGRGIKIDFAFEGATGVDVAVDAEVTAHERFFHEFAVDIQVEVR